MDAGSKNISPKRKDRAGYKHIVCALLEYFTSHSNGFPMQDEQGKVTVITEESRHHVAFQKGHTLAQTLFLSGHFTGRPLCAGLGRCGLCAVRFLHSPPPAAPKEIRLFSAEDIDSGWRLACTHQSSANMEVQVPRYAGNAVEPFGIQPHDEPLDVAIDVGTTSIKWKACSKATGKVSGTFSNPQMGAGSEVMARMAFARQSKDQQKYLQKVIQDAIQDVAGTGVLKSWVISGNAAMIYLLLGLDVTGLAVAPYRLTYRGGTHEDIVPGLPRAYIPPLISPFVGADISAGLCALRYHHKTLSNQPFIFCDMGTNGEFVLCREDTLSAASVALGPALEGVGLTFGKVAGEGVATGFILGPQGIVPESGTLDMRGISGSGYLSALSQLKKAGVLAEDGRFKAGATPLARRLSERIVQEQGMSRFYITDDVYISSEDVEEVLKVKAAFTLGLSELLKISQVTLHDVKALFLGGNLGVYCKPEDLEVLGFIPPGMANNTVPLGNTSLQGADVLLHTPKARDWISTITKDVKVLELAGRPDFGRKFVKHMRFCFEADEK